MHIYKQLALQHGSSNSMALENRRFATELMLDHSPLK
jgi:hypothetical protein